MSPPVNQQVDSATGGVPSRQRAFYTGKACGGPQHGWHPGLGVQSGSRCYEWHGDLFPLPMPCQPEVAARSGLSRGTRQRIQRRRAAAATALDAVQALNSLALGGDLDSRRAPFGADVGASRAQQCSVRDVLAAAAEPPEHGPEFESEAALRTLLRVGSSYDDSGSTGQIADFSRGTVSLPREQKTPVPLQLSK